MVNKYCRLRFLDEFPDGRCGLLDMLCDGVSLGMMFVVATLPSTKDKIQQKPKGGGNFPMQDTKSNSKSPCFQGKAITCHYGV